MKKALLIISMLTLLACNKRSEILDLPCKNFFNELKDDFEKDLKYQSYTVVLENLNNETFGFTHFVSLDLKSFYIEISLVSPICTDNNSKVIFLFSDESTSEYFIKSEPNCEGKILIDKPYISEFQNKILKGFRIKTFEGYADYNINENSKLELKKTAECYFKIANEKIDIK